jgi:hypothetical protein
MQGYLSVPITFRTFPRFAWLRRRSRLCAGGIHSRASSASATALVLLRASDIDIGHVAVVVFECPFTMSLDSSQPSQPAPRRKITRRWRLQASSVVVSLSLVPASRVMGWEGQVSGHGPIIGTPCPRNLPDLCLRFRTGICRPASFR